MRLNFRQTFGNGGMRLSSVTANHSGVSATLCWVVQNTASRQARSIKPLGWFSTQGAKCSDLFDFHIPMKGDGTEGCQRLANPGTYQPSSTTWPFSRGELRVRHSGLVTERVQKYVRASTGHRIHDKMKNPATGRTAGDKSLVTMQCPPVQPGVAHGYNVANRLQRRSNT